MLEDINIKDFILIDNVSLEFGRGFNVLTGETGAGKSILIGALTFLLGGKSSADQIRTGCKEAVVSGTVLIPAGNKAALNWLEERGVVPEENRVLLRRILKDNGRSLAWINELAVTRNELDEFTSYLFDIHGQHEHQNLLKAASHGPYLDLYCGISSKVEEFSSLYYRLSEKKKQLGELQLSEREKKEKLEYLEFAVSEIEEAKLTEGEEEILEQEESKLVNFEKLYGVLEQVNTLLGDESGIISLLKKNKNLLETAVPLDSTLESFLSRSENSFYEVQDIYEGLRQYQESLSFEPGRLEQVQERLSLIFKLKKKYAGSSDLSVKGILAFRDSALEEMKVLGQTYGYDISQPAKNAKEAIQWLYFGYLSAVKEQNGAAMSLGRTSTFLDIFIERDLKNGTLTESEAQELIDHFIMKLRLVKFARTPEYNSLFSGDPTWVTESIGGVGIDGRHMVTKNSFRYLHTQLFQIPSHS